MMLRSSSPGPALAKPSKYEREEERGEKRGERRERVYILIFYSRLFQRASCTNAARPATQPEMESLETTTPTRTSKPGRPPAAILLYGGRKRIRRRERKGEEREKERREDENIRDYSEHNFQT
jgi:hypothetical protein